MKVFRAVRIAAYAGIAILAIALWPGTKEESKPVAVRPAIGGPISLTAHTGLPFSSETLKGQPYVVFFGFTQCPEVCPTTLYELSRDLKALDPQSKDMRVLFVTVDPERDTPDSLANYLSSFDARIIGLTGTLDQIAATAEKFSVFFEKVPTSDGYTMNHTALSFLMDRDGKFFGTLDYEEGDKVKLEKLTRLLREG